MLQRLMCGDMNYIVRNMLICSLRCARTWTWCGRVRRRYQLAVWLWMESVMEPVCSENACRHSRHARLCSPLRRRSRNGTNWSQRIWNLAHELADAWFTCTAVDCVCTVCSGVQRSISPESIFMKRRNTRASCRLKHGFLFYSFCEYVPSSSFIYSYVNLIRLSWAPAKPFVCTLEQKCLCERVKKWRPKRKCKMSFLFSPFSPLSLFEAHTVYLKCMLEWFVLCTHHSQARFYHTEQVVRGLVLWCLCYGYKCKLCNSKMFVCILCVFGWVDARRERKHTAGCWLGTSTS